MKLAEFGDINNLGAGCRAIVIGDAMIDGYLDCRAVGISDEAPVTVLDWVGTKRTFGGMLNVAKSLRALGFATHVFGVVNENDDAGQFIHNECGRLDICEHWVSDNRPTTEKTRIGTSLEKSPSEQLARVDIECDDPLDSRRKSQLWEAIESLLQESYEGGTVVVVSDYMKGVIDEPFAQQLIKYCESNDIPILVDAKPDTLDWYRGATLLTPNEEEGRAYLLRKGERSVGISGGNLPALAEQLAKVLGSRVVLTAADHGVFLADGEGEDGESIIVTSVDAAPVTHVASTSGAGDVFLAMMATTAVKNEPWVEGMKRAQEVVGRSIIRAGTCAIEPEVNGKTNTH